MNRSAYQAILERQKDGKYIVALDTDDFHKLDTIPLTQAHVDTLKVKSIKCLPFMIAPYSSWMLQVVPSP